MKGEKGAAADEGNQKLKRSPLQVKKEQLTKGQKRNAWRKGGLNEEDRQRGWNWVDVIKYVQCSE